MVALKERLVADLDLPVEIAGSAEVVGDMGRPTLVKTGSSASRENHQHEQAQQDLAAQGGQESIRQEADRGSEEGTPRRE